MDAIYIYAGTLAYMDIGQRKREFSMQTNEQTKREGITYSRMSWKADVHAWLICPISGN